LGLLLNTRLTLKGVTTATGETGKKKLAGGEEKQGVDGDAWMGKKSTEEMMDELSERASAWKAQTGEAGGMKRRRSSGPGIGTAKKEGDEVEAMAAVKQIKVASKRRDQQEAKATSEAMAKAGHDGTGEKPRRTVIGDLILGQEERKQREEEAVGKAGRTGNGREELAGKRSGEITGLAIPCQVIYPTHPPHLPVT
jgi:hypothetical protein